MPTKNIRDMLRGPAHPDEAYTIRDFLAEAHEERVTYEDPTAGFTGRLPGVDPEPAHPLAETTPNPIPGVSVQGLSHALRSGAISDPGLRRRVAAYIDQYQKWTGEKVYDEAHHVEGTRSVNQGQVGLRRYRW